MSETEIKVPNIGDFKDVEIIEVLVSEDQTIQKNEATSPVWKFHRTLRVK